MARKKYYQLYKSEGRCTRCGAPAFKGGSMCLSCKEEFAAYMMEYRATHDRKKDKARHTEYMREKRERCRAAGVCVDCGAPVDGKSWRCARCNMKNAERQKEWRARDGRREP